MASIPGSTLLTNSARGAAESPSFWNLKDFYLPDLYQVIGAK